MTNTNDGGPGLRDWLAGTARSEDLVMPTNPPDCAAYLGVTLDEYFSDNGWLRVICKARYAYADAMLRAREAGR